MGNRSKQLFFRSAYEIQSTQPNHEEGTQAFLALILEVKKNGIQDMSLDEINAEIAKVRFKEETEG